MSYNTDNVEAASPLDILEQSSDLRQSDFWKEYTERLEGGRDMHTIITAASETGVGKTTLAFTLCMLGDMSGWHIGKATLDPAEYAHLYDQKNHCETHADRDEVPLNVFERCPDCSYQMSPGSWLLADEWEQAVDTRNSMSKENREASHQVATKRYRQIFAVYTAPSKSWIDNRFSEDAVDYWLQAQEGEDGTIKGEANVYRLKDNEHRGVSYHESPDETISWPVLDSHPEFQKLERLKKKRMEGDIQRTYIHRDEFEEAKKNFWNKATQKTRYHMVKAMVKDGMSQTQTADITQKAEHIEGVSQQRISQLMNTDSFEEAYKG